MYIDMHCSFISNRCCCVPCGHPAVASDQPVVRHALSFSSNQCCPVWPFSCRCRLACCTSRCNNASAYTMLIHVVTQSPLLVDQLCKCATMHCSTSNHKNCWQIINHSLTTIPFMLVGRAPRHQVHVSTRILALVHVATLYQQALQP